MHNRSRRVLILNSDPEALMELRRVLKEPGSTPPLLGMTVKRVVCSEVAGST
jgi:hypothetical protein